MQWTLILLLLGGTLWADPEVVPAEQIARKWTKSIHGPTEKIRYGLEVGTQPVEVDADTALSFQNIQFQRDGAELLDGVKAAQIGEIARALPVKRALEWHGVEPGRLQVLGFGDSDPVTANTDETARAKNRRVQIYRKL